MHVAKAAVAAAALLSFAVAGCFGGGSSGGGFSVKGPSSDGTYTFTASGGGDNFTWDLGDHLTRAYGKKVEHRYDFADGVASVVLTVRSGDGPAKEHRKEVTLGTGVNGNAAFVLEGGSNWTVLGETVRLSAHRSADPDGDPLRYTWSCQRAGDAVRQTPHVHAGFGGVPFATPPAGAVTSVNAQGPLPAPDRVVQGDLCDALGPGGRPSLDTTIEGAFTRSGIYDIYLLASDPVHPTTSGKYRIVATPASEKPNATEVFAFQGSFLVGAGGAVQGACGAVGQCQDDYDRTQHTFSLSLLGTGGYATLDYDDPTTAVGITCNLVRGTAPIATLTGPGANATLDPNALKAGTYTWTCQPQAGIPSGPDGIQYTLATVVTPDLDPFKVY